MAASAVPAEPRLQPRTGRLEPRCPSRDLSKHDDPNFSLPHLRPRRARPLASRDAGMPGPDPFEQRGRGAHAPASAPSGHGASRARGGDRGYEAEDEAEPKVRETYELLGRVVGAAARNMAIVEN